MKIYESKNKIYSDDNVVAHLTGECENEYMVDISDKSYDDAISISAVSLINIVTQLLKRMDKNADKRKG